MTRRKRERLLAEAQRLAEERAVQFATFRRTKKGELLTGFKLHTVTSTRKRNSLLEKGAKPVLPSSQWRAIYQEVGLS